MVSWLSASVAGCDSYSAVARNLSVVLGSSLKLVVFESASPLYDDPVGNFIQALEPYGSIPENNASLVYTTISAKTANIIRNYTLGNITITDGETPLWLALNAGGEKDSP